MNRPEDCHTDGMFTIRGHFRALTPIARSKATAARRQPAIALMSDSVDRREEAVNPWGGGDDTHSEDVTRSNGASAPNAHGWIGIR